MSSFIRTIERTVKRDEEGRLKSVRKHFGGRGSKLGYSNPKASDLLARIKRERGK